MLWDRDRERVGERNRVEIAGEGQRATDGDMRNTKILFWFKTTSCLESKMPYNREPIIFAASSFIQFILTYSVVLYSILMAIQLIV